MAVLVEKHGLGQNVYQVHQLQVRDRLANGNAAGFGFLFGEVT